MCIRDRALAEKIQEDVFNKMMKVMAESGREFKGVLYAGLMVQKNEKENWSISVIEFNTRFGDPEAQALLPLINEDLIPWFLQSAKGEFKKNNLQRKKESAVHLVLAADGYPGIGEKKIRKGDPVTFGNFNEMDEILYFAGVKKEKGQLLTNGGRVAGITCLDKNRMLARVKAYQKLKDINFLHAQMRDDIGL